MAVAQTLVISLVLARMIFPAIGHAGHAQALAYLIGVMVPVVIGLASLASVSRSLRGNQQS